MTYLEVSNTIVQWRKQRRCGVGYLVLTYLEKSEDVTSEERSGHSSKRRRERRTKKENL